MSQRPGPASEQGTPGDATSKPTSNTVTIVVAVIAAVATISAAIISSVVAQQASWKVAQLTTTVAQLQDRFTQMKTLAQSSHEAIPGIVKGSASANLEISNLYFLAQTAEDKKEVIRLVAFAKNPDLLATLNQILDGDAAGKALASSDPYIKALITFNAPPAGARQNGADVPPPAGNTETSLLRLTTLPASVGWSYLGEGSGDSNQLHGSSLRSSAVPNPGTVTFRRDVYLRSEPPAHGNKLAQAIGVVAAGQTAQLSDVHSVDLGGDRRTFWGRISLVVKGHGETDAPVLISPESLKFFSVSDAKRTSIVVRNIGKAPVHVSISVCIKGRSCTVSPDVSVPSVGDASDGANDYYYTVDGVDHHPLFDWKVWF